MPTLTDHTTALDELTPFPEVGLPEDIFYFISRKTPLVNVDLLIKNDAGEILLAWRDDEYAGTGWHLPGGIVRYKETFQERLIQVAKNEIGIELEIGLKPLAINEIIVEHKNRGHFVSLLFQAKPREDYKLENGNLGPQDPGFLAWHAGYPENLIKVHEVYRPFLGKCGK